MTSYSMTMAIPDLFRETDIGVLFEFEITSWGSSASWYDPGDPIEWEIVDIWVGNTHLPYSPKASPIYNALWQSLADAGQNYIDNNFDWSGALNDAAEDYYDER